MYIYIETSSPRVKGDYAEIVSHLLPANQTKCLELWYNMYGAETGNLKIYLEVCRFILNITFVLSTSVDCS